MRCHKEMLLLAIIVLVGCGDPCVVGKDTKCAPGCQLSSRKTRVTDYACEYITQYSCVCPGTTTPDAGTANLGDMK